MLSVAAVQERSIREGEIAFAVGLVGAAGNTASITIFLFVASEVVGTKFVIVFKAASLIVPVIEAVVKSKEASPACTV